MKSPTNEGGHVAREGARRFLRRHGWWLALGIVIWCLRIWSENRRSQKQWEGGQIAFERTFKLNTPVENPVGFPYPSFDPEGKLNYFKQEETAPISLTVWNHQTRTAVVEITQPDYLSEPIYSSALKQIVISSMSAEKQTTWTTLRILMFDRGAARSSLCFFDPDSGEIKRVIRLVGFIRPHDVSSDGQWLVATQRTGLKSEGYPKWTNHELSAGQRDEIVLINLNTEEVTRTRIRALAGYFDSSGDLIVVRQDGIIRLHRGEWEANPEPILTLVSPLVNETGEILSIRGAWLTQREPRQLFLGRRAVDRNQFGKSVLVSFELDNPGELTDWCELPAELHGNYLILPHVSGIANSTGLYLEAIDPKPYFPVSDNIYALHSVNATWMVTDLEGREHGRIAMDGIHKPMFINPDTLIWKANDNWIIRRLDDLPNGEGDQ